VDFRFRLANLLWLKRRFIEASHCSRTGISTLPVDNPFCQDFVNDDRLIIVVQFSARGIKGFRPKTRVASPSNTPRGTNGMKGRNSVTSRLVARGAHMGPNFE
jgi:hypothetical protein